MDPKPTPPPPPHAAGATKSAVLVLSRRLDQPPTHAPIQSIDRCGLQPPGGGILRRVAS